MSAFSAAFVSFFTALTTLCSAFNRFANGLDNIGKVVEESSAAYADQASIDRKKQLIKLNAELEATPAALEAPKA